LALLLILGGKTPGINYLYHDMINLFAPQGKKKKIWLQIDN